MTPVGGAELGWRLKGEQDGEWHVFDQSAVETLVIGDVGAAPAETFRAGAALPVSAVPIGLSSVRTDERLAPADGFGAVLRYAPALYETAQ